MGELASQHIAHLQRQERLNRTKKTITIREPEPERETEIAALVRQVAMLEDTVIQHGIMIGQVSKFMEHTRPHMHEIIDAVCEFYGIEKIDLAGCRRTANVTLPRQIVCYLGRSLTGISLPQIGRRLGDRDHTTVLHGANKISLRMKSDEILKDDIDVLEAKIADRVAERVKSQRERICR